MKVLILEDNVQLAKNIAEFLKIKGIKSETDFDGKRGYENALENHYDVILLDINLPVMDGLEICKNLRDNEKETPIIMLTSRTAKDDIVKGLELGADDYLGKPFDYDELLARIEAVNRRTKSVKNTVVEIKDVVVDFNRRSVKKAGEEIDMSTLEFDLLKFLVQNKGTPVDRKQILENVWGEFDAYMFSRNVDVYVGYLRKKLGMDFIKTKKGYGYMVE